MGVGLTDYQAKQIIEGLKGIERQLKIHNKREAERDARQVPTADPMGDRE